MRIVILAAALLLPGPALGAPLFGNVKYTAPAGQNCPAVSRFHAMKQGKGAKARKLGELPPADHYKAVFRTVRGCEVPVIAGFRPDGRRR